MNRLINYKNIESLQLYTAFPPSIPLDFDLAVHPLKVFKSPEHFYFSKSMSEPPIMDHMVIRHWYIFQLNPLWKVQPRPLTPGFVSEVDTWEFLIVTGMLLTLLVEILWVSPLCVCVCAPACVCAGLRVTHSFLEAAVLFPVVSTIPPCNTQSCSSAFVTLCFFSLRLFLILTEIYENPSKY